ncbi:MAG: hypothetical protein WAV12_10390 [Trebonia sp.]|uniref:hypothetical protein n=1 Tax=Trebonia sp. TaxID=2767075 RepID=UPI003BB07252
MEAAVAGLERGSIEVAGVRRTYWAARAPRVPGQPPGPLLIVLRGSGMDGRAIARWTGLAKRGSADGVTTVFPDGWTTRASSTSSAVVLAATRNTGRTVRRRGQGRGGRRGR